MMASKTDIIEFEKGWAAMEKGIAKVKLILEELADTQFSSSEYIDLYTTIYNMCTQKPPHEYSAKLYDKYGETFVEYINSTVLPCLREKHDEFLLREFAKRWSNHKVMVKWLRRFFHYLERYYIVRKARTALNDVGINCFRDLVYQGVRVNVRDAVTTLIHKEREGEQIDRALLKNALGIFVEIGMGHMDYYDIDFEAHLVNDTATYYSRKASKWIVEDSCPDYMLKCEECLNKERDRVSHYLHSSSETKLIDAVQHELLVVHSTALLIDKEHSGCMALLRHDKVVDLSRMFRLYCKIPQGLEPIAKMFQQQITAEGTALFQQAEAEDAAANQSSNVAFIWKVIKLHDKYMVYVTDCFKNTSLLHKALKVAFIGFCNKTVCGNSSAELLANFCDTIVLKKGGTEKSSDEAMEVTFEKVVTLLTYIHEKDLFAEFYRKKLAGRLLSDRRLSVDDDLERNILTKLKQQFGAHFTSKMEGMVTDMILARENKSSYEDYLGNNSAAVHPGIDLTVSVLTTGFWPTYKDSDVKLPAEMLKCMQAFQSFYKTKTKSRRLTWLYSQGTCLVNGNFEQKLELVVSTYQAAVLLLFNGSDRLSYWEIVEQFNLPHHELARVLHSLSCGRYKILLKEPNTKSVLKSDFFVFNSKFTDRSRRRIKIPLPSIDDEKKKIVENVDNDRRIYIDSAIVRIMKSRKVLGYQQLVAECVEQLSRTFKPDVKAIKKRMEDLIARAYLERDQDNPNMFKYLA